jgi:hypothetical protein
MVEGRGDSLSDECQFNPTSATSRLLWKIEKRNLWLSS